MSGEIGNISHHRKCKITSKPLNKINLHIEISLWLWSDEITLERRDHRMGYACGVTMSGHESCKSRW